MSKPITISINSQSMHNNKRLSIAVPVHILKEAELSVGDRINVSFDEGNCIVIKKVLEGQRGLADIYQPATIKNVAFININVRPVGFEHAAEFAKQETEHRASARGLAVLLPVALMDVRRKAMAQRAPVKSEAEPKKPQRQNPPKSVSRRAVEGRGASTRRNPSFYSANKAA